MKKPIIILATFFAIALSAHAGGHRMINSYADAFIFDEMGVTFSVYPDGEFDFYMPEYQFSNTVSNGYVSATFNSGYDYNPYVQYDDFGAVIQVENVPVYYDYYGRVDQIGDVLINYRNRRISQVGGLFVFYNSYGYYSHCSGYINMWNPYFVYRPFYAGFVRPLPNLCFVSYNPYRQYYHPFRYAYYRPYVHNTRRFAVTIGHTYRANGHGASYRYAQTPRTGETAVMRSRRTITTADASPRPSTINRSRTANAHGSNRPAYSRSNSAAKPNMNRTSSSRTVTQRPTSVKPTNSARRPVNVRKPNAGTTSRSPQMRTNTVSHRNAQSSSRDRSVSKPTSNSRTQSVSKPSTQRGSSRTTSRSATKPQTSARSSASKPRTNAVSRTARSSGRSKAGVSKSTGKSSSSPKATGRTTAKRNK